VAEPVSTGDIRSRAAEATAATATVVLIPARLKATRLPDKPLLPIAGLPMIVHVWRRAVEAGLGPVVVACAEERSPRR
jgi:3-deoxy-manno-octulosonate cytidylyltransferase (CMP-KDO synthetase)